MKRKSISLFNFSSSLIEEWLYDRNTVNPHEVSCKSGKKVWWICKKCNEKWEATICNRSNGSGCPYCRGLKVGESNNLLYCYPEIAKEWHPTKNGKLTPELIMPKYGKKVWWLCVNGHEWEAVITSRSNGNNCPFCSKIFAPRLNMYFRSLVEVYFALDLLKKGIQFEYEVRYCKDSSSQCLCDFYLPKEKMFIEVTGFNKRWKYWTKYLRRIANKKQMALSGGKSFKFIEKTLSPKEIKAIKKEVVFT